MIDPSILGFTQDEFNEMDPEEREEAFKDNVNRAIDLLEATMDTFPSKMASINQADLRYTLHNLKAITR